MKKNIDTKKYTTPYLSSLSYFPNEEASLHIYLGIETMLFILYTCIHTYIIGHYNPLVRITT